MDDRYKYKWIEKITDFRWDVVMFDIEGDYAQVVIASEPEMPNDEVKLSDGKLIQCTAIRDKEGKGELIFEGDYLTNPECDSKDEVFFDNKYKEFRVKCDAGEYSLWVYLYNLNDVYINGSVFDKLK